MKVSDFRIDSGPREWGPVYRIIPSASERGWVSLLLFSEDGAACAAPVKGHVGEQGQHPRPATKLHPCVCTHVCTCTCVYTGTPPTTQQAS